MIQPTNSDIEPMWDHMGLPESYTNKKNYKSFEVKQHFPIQMELSILLVYPIFGQTHRFVVSSLGVIHNDNMFGTAWNHHMVEGSSQTGTEDQDIKQLQENGS